MNNDKLALNNKRVLLEHRGKEIVFDKVELVVLNNSVISVLQKKCRKYNTLNKCVKVGHFTCVVQDDVLTVVTFECDGVSSSVIQPRIRSVKKMFGSSFVSWNCVKIDIILSPKKNANSLIEDILQDRLFFKKRDNSKILAVSTDTAFHDLVFFYVDFKKKKSHSLRTITYTTKKDIFSRLQGIFETDILKNKIVSIIGLGTGGSLASIELAKCGVRRFRLVDFDRLEPHNIGRHACGIKDIGRMKTKAVRDLLLNINPDCEIEIFEFNVLDDDKQLRKIVSGSNLVLVGTDSERSKYKINLVCLQENVPAIYAGAYERAFGGEVFRVVPGRTPCYDCVKGNLQKQFENRPKPRSHVAYSKLEGPEDFKAEPGLGLDVHFIVLLQVKMALLTLLRGTESKLEDLEYDFLLWGNRKEWIFPEPFYCQFAKIEVRNDCPTCQLSKKYVQEKGLSKEEIANEAKKIISEAKVKKDIFMK